ncbi:hypothetical protein GCM10025858_14970 [Alicyclobacillus sacchari]|nr:hypothetical protein GCM10025858_14970 [Alicyclobacillus sacchari]
MLYAPVNLARRSMLNQRLDCVRACAGAVDAEEVGEPFGGCLPAFSDHAASEA